MDYNQEHIINEYVQLVCDRNRTLNLTSVDSLDEARVIHAEDSLVGLQEVQDAPQGVYADIGSGGGFPGVPLAIATGRRTVLVDSTKKKMSAVLEMVHALGIDNIECYAGRIEDYALEHPASCAVATARALAPLPSLIELASPLLIHGGRFVAYKGPDFQEELDQAISIQEKVGMRFVSMREAVLSDGVSRRCILVFEKACEPAVALPRRVGVAQKRPFA